VTTLRALVLGCSLKASPALSSSELLGREVLAALADHDVDGELIRIVDHRVHFGCPPTKATATSGRRSGRRSSTRRSCPYMIGRTRPRRCPGVPATLVEVTVKS
jgi:hypothetical protein